jgi:excisionase family DNA binding protein
VPAARPAYTTIEIARRLGVSLQTVQRWVDAGQVESWKTPGGHRRIDAASAERLFAEQGLTSAGTDAGAPTAAESVLIVDDNPIDRELLVDLVRGALPGSTIEQAENGFQGLLAVGRSAPTIVLTDIHMPHIDGFEMLRQLCANGPSRPRILVAVSAHAEADLAALGRLPAGVPYLRKPVDAERFSAILRGAR